MALSTKDEIGIILSYLESSDFDGILDAGDKELAQALVHEILGFKKPPTGDALNFALGLISRDVARSGYLSARYYSVKLQYEDMVRQVEAEEDISLRDSAREQKLKMTDAAVERAVTASARLAGTRRSAQLAAALSGLFFQLNKAMESRARALEQISNNERQISRVHTEA